MSERDRANSSGSSRGRVEGIASLLIGASAGAAGHNARVRIYPDGGAEVLICSRPIFREPGWEARSEAALPLADQRAFEAEDRMVEAERAGRWLSDGEEPPKDVANILRAVRRAKARVRLLARATTSFQYFVTLTLDASKVDRYDETAVIKKASAWLSNQVQRRGLAYILVPERHKDGAIHFHGFINGALPLVDSGTMVPPAGGKPKRPRSRAQRIAWASEGGHLVYNVPAWSFGFSTAIELYGNRAAAVAYVCKYIGKQQAGELPERIGGRWYYSGGELSEPETLYCDLLLDEARVLHPEGYGFEVPEAKAEYYTYEMEGDDERCRAQTMEEERRKG